MWLSTILAVGAIVILFKPDYRRHDGILAIACAMVFLSTWIDKGLGLVVGGFAITPLDTVTDYTPTAPELLISFGIYAIGGLVLTVLYKIAISIKEEA
jgi:molybdopterin-containing oxidoreductase family membrane subunit